MEQQAVEVEHKLDTVLLVMGELGLLEAHSDAVQGSGSDAGTVLFSVKRRSALKYLRKEEKHVLA